MLRTLLDRLFVLLTLLVLRAFFRSVEVQGRDRIPRDRPLLLVANHFNGFVDAVILVHVLGRVPRFLAKAPLWRWRVVRPLLSLLGMIPVHRSQDGPAHAANTSAFAAAHQALARRGQLAIFPEGITHDDPRLARIRTGAARIALGARQQGVAGLVVVPVGMAFDDKLALRSRVLARVGEPIDLDADLDLPDDASEDDTERVRALTRTIESRLRAVSPDYRDRREAKVLARAAEIRCRTELERPYLAVPLERQESLAQRLAGAPRDRIARLTDILARYQLHLDVVGLRDHQVAWGPTPAQLLGGLLRLIGLVAVLAPLWLPGLLINLVPYHLTSMVGRVVRNPVMKGTARVLLALVVFPVTWVGLLAVVGVQGWTAWTLALAALPTAGLIAVAVLERIVRGFRVWRGWLALVERRALREEILAERRRLVREIDAVLAQAPRQPQQVRAAS